MAATTMTLNRPRFPWVILLVMFTAAAAGLVLSSHAEKHTLADVVRNCPSDNIGLILRNPFTGRRAILCEYEPGQWGRIIEDRGHEVTAFANARRTHNTLAYALRNLTRSGYTKIEFLRSDLVDVIIQILAK